MARKSQTQMATEFESDVRKFLQDLDFNDVRGGSDFRLSGKQIDASFGTTSLTYVVVSCTTKGKDTLDGSIEEKVNELKSWHSSIKKGLDEFDSLKKYERVKLVLATKGARPTERDKELCKTEPRVYLWDEQFFDYYRTLREKIGTFAKYELQRELEIQLGPEEFENLSDMPTLKVALSGGQTYYLTSIYPLDLLKVSYVARKERGDQSFYQRMINNDKIKKISFQIQKNGLSFFNNLILSTLGENGIEFKESFTKGNVSTGSLSVNENLGGFWIVDGQHRLYGYSRVRDLGESRTARIPVSIIINKNERDQGEIFISINTNQTPLSEDYKWDLYGTYLQDPKRNTSALTPKKLNKLENLKGRIYIPSITVSRKHGMIGISKLSRTIFEQPKLFYGNLNDNRPNPIFKNSDEDEKNASRLANFIDSSLTLVKECDPWLFRFFTTTTGIQIFIIILCSQFLYFGGSEKNASEYLTTLCKYSVASQRFTTETKIKNIEKSLNSREEKSKFIDELIRETNERIRNDGLQISPLLESVRSLSPQNVERLVRDFVKEELSTRASNWFKHYVPTDVRDLLRRKHPNTDDEALWEFIDLGSLIKIIESSSNWETTFRGVFLVVDSIFIDKDDVIYTFKNFKKYRDSQSHARSVDSSDKQLGEAAANKIKKFIETYNEKYVQS